MRQLTMKQHRFVDEYINTGNASEAYRRSYDCKKSSNKTISIEATKLINSPNVALAVKREKERLSRSSRLGSKELEKRMIDIYDTSFNEGQYNVALNALNAIAKLNGLIVNKEHRIVNGSIEHSHVSLLEAIKQRRTVRDSVPGEQLENDNVLMLKDKTA
tara:strand:+ start:174 stop:653 length:480 start_codon:yes stop_codon:yes gene_type:complete